MRKWQTIFNWPDDFSSYYCISIFPSRTLTLIPALSGITSPGLTWFVLLLGAFNQGPHPITKLPEDKSWYLQWPYGEMVASSGFTGTITDIYYLEDGCMLYETTFGSEIKRFVYPCDYIDSLISFLDEKNQKGFQNDIEHKWRTQEKIEETYKIRDAWQRWLIEPR